MNQYWRKGANTGTGAWRALHVALNGTKLGYAGGWHKGVYAGRPPLWRMEKLYMTRPRAHLERLPEEQG
jgi:hypothetical protein